MKTIRLTSDFGGEQIFEKLESRKELQELLNLFDSMDDDNTFYIEYKDGSTAYFSDCDIPKIKAYNITRFVYNNPSTICFYGDYSIIQNERYDYYELNDN